MLIQLLTGALVGLANFGIHAAMTGLIVVITRRIAGTTDELHVFMRISALMLVTVVALTATHVPDIVVWAAFISVAGITAPNLTPFEFAFENYVALGHGYVVTGSGRRPIGPIMALNGLLLIGWSVAIIFEVMRMAELQFGRRSR